MGATYSARIIMHPNFNYFSMQFVGESRLRLIAPPTEILNDTKGVLTQYLGIQKVSTYEGFLEIKLNSSPWFSTEDGDANAKFCLCALLKQYYKLGWHIRVSTDLQRYGHDPSVIMFEKANQISTHVICLSLNSPNKIRVMGPEDLISHIRTSIISFWPQGIQREKILGRSYEFKLRGNIWGGWSADRENSYHSVALINNIFASLYKLGWVFISAIDSSNYDTGLNSLYFRYDPEETLKEENVNSCFFALSLNSIDKIRFINAPDDLVRKIKFKINEYWRYGLEKEKFKYGAYILKLNGSPWLGLFDETVESRKLMCGLLSFINDQNWQLYATCTLNTHKTSKSTLFFRSTNTDRFRCSCVSLNHVDKLRLINMDDYFKDITRLCIMRAWPKGINNEYGYHGSWQFCMYGRPFSNPWLSDNSIYRCLMMMLILSAFQEAGKRFITSLDLSAKCENEGESQSTVGVTLHSWFFKDRC